MSFHKDSPTGNNHLPHNWTFTSEALRNDSIDPNTGLAYAISEISKLSLQTDTWVYYSLKDTVPTWIAVGGGGTATTYANESFTGITGTSIVLANTPQTTIGVVLHHNNNYQIYGTDYTVDIATKTITLLTYSIVSDDIEDVQYFY